MFFKVESAMVVVDLLHLYLSFCLSFFRIIRDLFWSPLHDFMEPLLWIMLRLLQKLYSLNKNNKSYRVI